MVGRAKWSFLVETGSMAVSTGIVKATSSLFFTGEENTFHTWAIIVAGTFVLIAVCLSMFLIFEHLTAYKNPEEQKFLIGVILMVPCYAVESIGILRALPAQCWDIQPDKANLTGLIDAIQIPCASGFAKPRRVYLILNKTLEPMMLIAN